MRFDILTLFPEAFQSYFQASILKRAQEAGQISIALHDVRAYSLDKHGKVDDTPYGGGAGMVMAVEPFDRALQSVVATRGTAKTRIILLSAKGQPFDQAKARELAECDRLVLLCGRYEGVDERVAAHLVDEEISIGPYVLTGGEIPAMVLVDAVARLLPGVLGNEESPKEESYTDGQTLEFPQYTKPEDYRGWKVPPVLLSGNHAEIARWRLSQSAVQTKKRYALEIPTDILSA